MSGQVERFGKRGERGRFLPGTTSGPGNPLAGKVYKLRAALYEEVGEDKWRKIVQRCIEDAAAGDPLARRELFDRLLGKPGLGIDLAEDQLLTRSAAQALAVAIVDATRARLGSTVADELMADLTGVLERAG